jgi:hypothetical protein
MSIKIYEAYKLPVSKLNEFLGICTETAVREFSNFRFYALYRRCKKGNEEYIKQLLKQNYPEDAMASLMFEEALRDSSLFHDYGVSLNIWIDGTFAYAIPYGIHNLVPPEWAEDFHYQNSTDRPDGISAQTYSARRRKWDKLCLKDWDATRLQYEILVFSRYHGGTVNILTQLCKDKQPWLLPDNS